MARAPPASPRPAGSSNSTHQKLGNKAASVPSRLVIVVLRLSFITSPPNAKEQVRSSTFGAFVQGHDSSWKRFRKCLWHEDRHEKARGERQRGHNMDVRCNSQSIGAN